MSRIPNPFPRTAASLLLALLTTMAVTSPALAAWSTDPQINNPVCLGNWVKGIPVVTTDGAGGAFIAWEDFRSTFLRIYVQHVLANGTIAPGWPANGIHLTPGNLSNHVSSPVICSDGAGGAVIAFRYQFSGIDNDIYIERISGSGTILWNNTGVVVAGSSVDQSTPRIAPDGTNGAYVVWTEGATPDVWANHIHGTGGTVAGWVVNNGNVICNAANSQFSPRAAPDGAGGLLCAWIDQRGPSPNAIFVQRLQPNGLLAPGWLANGEILMNTTWPINDYGVAATPTGGLVAVWSENESADMNVRAGAVSPNGNGTGSRNIAVLAGTDQFITSAIPDGAGGAFVAWEDDRGGDPDIFACRLNGSGEIAAGWPSGGVPIGGGTGNQDGGVVALDGTGGFYAAWGDLHLGVSADVFAGHVLGNGTTPEGWAFPGNPIATATSGQVLGGGVSDGLGGCILAWYDARNMDYADIYCQRVERYGRLGNPEPSIASIRDVANDQGGSVRVSWNASYLDAYPTNGVTQYWLWRQVPATVAWPALAHGARLDEGEASAPAVGTRLFRANPLSAEAYFWEFVGSQTANQFPGYSLVAATESDSLPGSYPRTVFMVEARGGGTIHWDSAPDSGYSVDNLAPAAPQPFGAFYVAGKTYLHWGPNTEPDLDGYRLYRGTTSGFTPSPANRIASPPDTGYTDQNGGFYYYKISAVDVHGNESATSLAFPSSTTDAPDDPLTTTLSFAGATPNPMRGPGPVSWTLARRGRVKLALYDVGGRRVRELVDTELPAGAHTARWDLRDERGAPVGSGVYFAVLEADGQSLRARIGVVR